MWRLGLLLALPVALLLFFVGREKDADEHVPDEHGPQGGKLSAKFWISWFGFVACISSEFATSFWAAALLKDRVGSTAAIFQLLRSLRLEQVWELDVGTVDWFSRAITR